MQQQLLATAPARHQSDAGLDQAAIKLGRGAHLRAVQQDLTAAAQGAPGRGHDHRDGTVFGGHIHVLEGFDDALELRPLAHAGAHEQQGQVGAN